MANNRKEIMVNLHNQGYTYAYISKVFHLSRQRVHQIITGYKSFSQAGLSFNRYKNLNTSICRCCKDKAIHVHHIDGNSHNNEEKNLMPLCKICHLDIHSGRIT